MLDQVGHARRGLAAVYPLALAADSQWDPEEVYRRGQVAVYRRGLAAACQMAQIPGDVFLIRLINYLGKALRFTLRLQAVGEAV
jgi:hypothetical protein